jgi:hypothetical protein
MLFTLLSYCMPHDCHVQITVSQDPVMMKKIFIVSQVGLGNDTFSIS